MSMNSCVNPGIDWWPGQDVPRLSPQIELGLAYVLNGWIDRWGNCTWFPLSYFLLVRLVIPQDSFKQNSIGAPLIRINKAHPIQQIRKLFLSPIFTGPGYQMPDSLCLPSTHIEHLAPNHITSGWSYYHAREGRGSGGVLRMCSFLQIASGIGVGR